MMKQNRFEDRSAGRQKLWRTYRIIAEHKQ